MTNRDLILEVLENTPSGLCDDCLSEKSNVKPRQTINMTCRPLAKAGILIRQKSYCSGCEKSKITNKLTKGINNSFAKVATKSLLSDIDVVALQRQLIKLLDHFDLTGEKDSISQRIGKLRDKGVIPGNITVCMRSINGFRNLVIHEDYKLNDNEKKIVELAWITIQKWNKQTAYFGEQHT
jgi:uncharacterized protein YutE (UPF0331/DUF86 family)